MSKTLWEQEIQVKDLAYVVAGFCGLYSLYQICAYFKGRVVNYSLQRKAKAFRQERDRQVQSLQIPDYKLTEKYSNGIIQRVLSSDIGQLKQMLQEKVVSSEDLVNIFSFRCQKYGIEHEIITHLKYEEAIEQARKCDELRKQNSPLCNAPLFGIPISVKESYYEKNYPSTAGCISKLNNVPKEDGLNVRILKEAGAIPFVRTNVPQLLLTFESMNAIYGRVKNPWDTSKLAGGSSGGEGAAIAGRLSPAGIGSDIGGSIRIPAAMNGVYGFKPCYQRNIDTGEISMSKASEGFIILQAVSGPLGSSVDDLILMYKTIMDPTTLQKYKRSERHIHNPMLSINETDLTNNKKGRRFGYFKTLDVVEAALPCQRAVQLSVDYLISQGHQVVEIQIPFASTLEKLFFNVFFADNLQSIYKIMDGEDLADEYKELEMVAQLPSFLRSSIGFLLGLFGQKRLKNSLNNTKSLNVYEFNIVAAQVKDCQKEMTKIFEDNQIEAIICPSFGSPALPHKASKSASILALYTFMWNILNFPSGVLPVTLVQEDEQHYKNCPIGDQISKDVNKLMAQNTKGLPVGVQVVSQPFQEETCLNVMNILDHGIKFYKHNKFPEF